MYTVDKASKQLGLDVSQVRRLLRSGEIKGKKWGRDWMVLDLSYERKRRPKTKNKVTEV
jgi:excisionase family DNA binding protein